MIFLRVALCIRYLLSAEVSSKTGLDDDVDDVTLFSALDVVEVHKTCIKVRMSSRTDLHDDVVDVVVVGARRS